MNHLLEKYEHTDEGYNPYLIRQDWQVAKLNYMPDQALDGIKKIDVHRQTDEAFVLIRGIAILIVAKIDNEGNKQFKCEQMKSGITYNVPKDVWHNIALDESTEVIIVEKKDTHLGDFEFIYLNDSERSVLQEMIMEEASVKLLTKNSIK